MARLEAVPPPAKPSSHHTPALDSPCCQTCLLDQLGATPSQHSPQIGWALDGFPVYGPRGPGGVLMKTCMDMAGDVGPDGSVYRTHRPDQEDSNGMPCLDPCGGREGTDPNDGYTYRYYVLGEYNDGASCVDPLEPLAATSGSCPATGGVDGPVHCGVSCTATGDADKCLAEQRAEYFPFTPVCLRGCCPLGQECKMGGLVLPPCSPGASSGTVMQTSFTVAQLGQNTNNCDVCNSPGCEGEADCSTLPAECTTTCLPYAYCITGIPDANCANAPQLCADKCSAYAHCANEFAVQAKMQGEGDEEDKAHMQKEGKHDDMAEEEAIGLASIVVNVDHDSMTYVDTSPNSNSGKQDSGLEGQGGAGSTYVVLVPKVRSHPLPSSLSPFLHAALPRSPSLTPCQPSHPFLTRLSTPHPSALPISASKDADDGDAVLLTYPDSKMRELSIQEGRTYRRRRLAEIGLPEHHDSSEVPPRLDPLCLSVCLSVSLSLSFSFAHLPSPGSQLHFADCTIFHCFFGDDYCEEPSPRSACLRWADDGTCADPLCKYTTAQDE